MLDQDGHRLVDQTRLLLPVILEGTLHVLAAILILILGFWIARRAEGLVGRSLGRTHYVDPMLRTFLGTVARYFVLTFAGLAVLSEFGIQTASLVAILDAAGLAVGLAWQGTLSHLAAGVMLLIFRPFRVDHRVQVAGVDGTVMGLSLFWTELVTDANVQVIIPNGSVWGQPLRNYSVYPQPTAMSEARFRLPPGADPDSAKRRIEAAAASVGTIRSTPRIGVFFDRDPEDNALEIVVSFAPADPKTAAGARSDLTRAVYEALEPQFGPAA
jgi:small conductance mechanosensitive channel